MRRIAQLLVGGYRQPDGPLWQDHEYEEMAVLLGGVEVLGETLGMTQNRTSRRQPARRLKAHLAMCRRLDRKGLLPLALGRRRDEGTETTDLPGKAQEVDKG